MKNPWLDITKAKKIANALNDIFIGRTVEEDVIWEFLWSLPEYDDDVWLNVLWNDDDSVSEIEVGVGENLVC